MTGGYLAIQRGSNPTRSGWCCVDLLPLVAVLAGVLALLPSGGAPVAQQEQADEPGTSQIKTDPDHSASDEITADDSDTEDQAAEGLLDEAVDSGVGAILQLQGMITDVMLESLRRRVDDAKEQGATIIIFDMDTPGGLVTSSIAIADLIKNLQGVKTVAWVNPNAHSGGSIVAVACDEIVMARSSRIGDSQVIMGGPGGATAVPEELQAKAYTPVLAEFRASARLRGYDQVLCEAFVLPQREVWWLENIETGEREFVFRDEKLRRFGEHEDPSKHKDSENKTQVDSTDAEMVDASDAADGAQTTESPLDTDRADPEWRLVEKYYDPLLEMEVDTIQPIVRDDQLLEMSAGEAQAYGFSKGIVTGESDLRARYDLGKVVHFSPSWSEALAYWLTSMYVRAFLMIIIMLGAYVEFHTPGVGVPGLVALITLAIFVGAPYLTGLANVWEILLIALGVLLIAVEVFVIPGFGLAGIAGVVFLIVGLLATFIPEEPGRSFPLYIPSLPSTLAALRGAVVTLVSSMVASLVGMILLSRFLPKTPLFRAFVPANPTPSQVAPDDVYRGAARVGDLGMAQGPLHPAGKAMFGSVLVDVVSQGGYLAADTRIEVVERRGNRVVVRAARRQSPDESSSSSDA